GLQPPCKIVGITPQLQTPLLSGFRLPFIANAFGGEVAPLFAQKTEPFDTTLGKAVDSGQLPKACVDLVAAFQMWPVFDALAVIVDLPAYLGHLLLDYGRFSS